MISSDSISNLSSLDDVLKAKKRANLALNSGEYQHAVELYSCALALLVDKFGDETQVGGLKVDQLIASAHQEACIISKRSVALLKLGKMYYAYRDALTVIEIDENWFKGKYFTFVYFVSLLLLSGYLRKANVELEVGLYREAMKNFQLALRYLDEDDEEKRSNYEKFINQSVRHTISMMAREQCLSVSIPWIGAAFGLVVGMALVAWDFISFGPGSYIHHPILKLIVIGLCSVLFFQLATWKCYFKEKSKRQSLEPPEFDTFKTVDDSGQTKKKVD